MLFLEAKNKNKGTGPGPTEVALGVALYPPLNRPLAISKARGLVAGDKSKGKGT